jgi:CpeT protein
MTNPRRIAHCSRFSFLVRMTYIGAFASLALAGCATIDADPFPKETATYRGQREVELLASFLAGTWKSAPDLVDKIDATPTSLRQVRIWPERKGEFWIYAEYARPDDEARPFRQRVYRIGEGGGKIRAIVYRLPGDPLRFAGEWRKALAFEGLSPADLIERKGCRIEFYYLEPLITFEGKTIGLECAPDAPGAAYDIVDYYLSSASLRTWERGFDPAGAQVTGSRVGPLKFMKTSEKVR